MGQTQDRSRISQRRAATSISLPTDSTGRYAAMYKPFHLIGLELSISVLRSDIVNAARDYKANLWRTSLNDCCW
jgi:predicted homoserine dehydrogenase-like protein